MAFDFIVLGGTGMQGRIVSKDLLLHGYSVLLCGRDKPRVDKILSRFKKAQFQYLDLNNLTTAKKIIKDSGSDILVNCAEGDWNVEVAEICGKLGINCIDLGSEIWLTRKQLEFDGLYKKNKIIHITGCGSVPGIGNVMLAHAAAKFDTLKDVECGFAWNSNIKKFVVPYSIGTIVEEFTFPAMIIKNGKIVKKVALEKIEEWNDSFAGKQQALYVQHAEPYTFYRYFKNQGLKNVRFYAEFPPHSFNTIKMLMDLGLGSEKMILVNGVKVMPVEVLIEVLKNVKPPRGYREVEDLWVTVIGKKNGKKKTTKMQCLVKTLKGWEDAGSNIDTGIPASIMAQMIKNKIIAKKGCFAPEACVPPAPFFAELRKYQMVVYENGKAIN